MSVMNVVDITILRLQSDLIEVPMFLIIHCKFDLANFRHYAS